MKYSGLPSIAARTAAGKHEAAARPVTKWVIPFMSGVARFTFGVHCVYTLPALVTERNFFQETMTGTIERVVTTAAILLTRKIAEGGMSIVYEGCQLGAEGFTKRVAVKMLLQKWTENERFMALFAAEAKLVSDLVHENIVQILQLGRLPDRQYYIIMELVEGLSLYQFMLGHQARGMRIPEPLVVHIASRIARGLAYAHGFKDGTGRLLGIVHRDVCPKNVLITNEGLAKLTDFGIAKARHTTIIDDRWLTGKTKYMSPEQAARQAVDFRADIFALGAVMFEMLAGLPIRPPDADPLHPDFLSIPVPWDRLPADVGPELAVILRRMLDPVPDRRFQDTRELARALEYYIYKDGYGPTIQTVEEYLRHNFPDLYQPKEKTGMPEIARAALVDGAAHETRMETHLAAAVSGPQGGG
jgi:serine/threonine protein kinase